MAQINETIYLMNCSRAEIVELVRAMLCLMLLAAAGGCKGTQQGGGAATPANAEQGRPAASRQITGVVKHLDLEGSFYGIITDDGQRLDPVNLPGAFQQDGLRIKARVEPLEGQVSVHMWGTLVRIIDIQRVQ